MFMICCKLHQTEKLEQYYILQRLKLFSEFIILVLRKKGNSDKLGLISHYVP